MVKLQLSAELCDTAVTKGCESLKLAGPRHFTFPDRSNCLCLTRTQCNHLADDGKLFVEKSHFRADLRALLMFLPFPYIFSLLIMQSTTIRYIHFDSSTSFAPRQNFFLP
jgi:hypothetical protein